MSKQDNQVLSVEALRGDNALKQIAIVQALNGREVFTDGYFLIRPTSDGRCLFMGPVQNDILVPMDVKPDNDQFWQSLVLLSPIKRYRDDHGILHGYSASQVMTSHVSLEGMTEIPTQAPGSVLVLPGVHNMDKISTMLHEDDLLAPTILWARRVSSKVAGSDENITLIGGVINWPGPAPQAGQKHAADEVWCCRLVIMPNQRWQDRDGLTTGYTADMVLTSHIDPSTCHKID